MPIKTRQTVPLRALCIAVALPARAKRPILYSSEKSEVPTRQKIKCQLLRHKTFGLDAYGKS